MLEKHYNKTTQPRGWEKTFEVFNRLEKTFVRNMNNMPVPLYDPEFTQVGKPTTALQSIDMLETHVKHLMKTQPEHAGMKELLAQLEEFKTVCPKDL